MLLPRPWLDPRLPRAPSLGNAPSWSSPWSPWSPVRATSLVSGAWWNSFLEFSSISALLRRIRTGSFTCLIKGHLKLLKAFIMKSTFSPSCSSVQRFHRGLSSCSFLRFPGAPALVRRGFFQFRPRRLPSCPPFCREHTLFCILCCSFHNSLAHPLCTLGRCLLSIHPSGMVLAWGPSS